MDTLALKQVIDEAIVLILGHAELDANETVPGRKAGTTNSLRSSAFVHALGNGLRDTFFPNSVHELYVTDKSGTTFAKEAPGELLWDITIIARHPGVAFTLKGVDHSGALRLVMAVESEFSNLHAELLYDFNKLILTPPDAALLFVMRKDIDIDKLRPRFKALIGARTNVWLARVSHPDSWRDTAPEVAIESLSEWAPP